MPDALSLCTWSSAVDKTETPHLGRKLLEPFVASAGADLDTIGVKLIAA